MLEREAVVLLSGGLDSMVAAGLALKDGFALNALTIDYGQRHRKEIESAKQIAKVMGVKRHVILPLSLRAFGGSALTDEIDVPKSGVGQDIPVTYVPARNLIFLSLTLAWAETIEARDIFIGVNALDYSGYPDCRPEFITQFTKTANLATRAGSLGQDFTLHTPLQYWGKGRIVEECLRLGLDPGLSWSCYDPAGDGMPCGLCDSCRLRQKGFADAGLQDPVVRAR